MSQTIKFNSGYTIFSRYGENIALKDEKGKIIGCISNRELVLAFKLITRKE